MISVRRLIPMLVSAAVLVLPAMASAGIQVHKLSGVFHGENVPGTGKVSIKVVVKDGKPVSVKELKYKNLPAGCNVSETPGSPIFEPAGTLSGDAGKNRNPPGIEVGRRLQWFSYPGNGARQVTMNGRLNKSGTKIFKGRLEVGNNQACQGARGTFTAKK